MLATTNMGLFEVVVLVFSLYLTTVIADEVTCESESGGTCNLAGAGCYRDAIPCSLPSRSVPTQNTPACTNGVCSVQQDTSCSVPKSVQITASTFDSDFFNVHVSWSVYERYPGHGFRVRLKQRYNNDTDPDYLDLGCVCLNASQRNYSFYMLQYMPNYHLLAQVSMLPCAQVKSSEIPFPAGCLDLPYDHIHCRLPAYNSPRNVRAYRSIGENSVEKSILISWEPPIVPSPYPEPTMYYVEVNNHDLGGPILKTNNTTSVSVHHLNASITYQVRVTTYVPCSGAPADRFGCKYGSWVQVMSEPSSSIILPTPMLSSTVVAMTTESPPHSSVIPQSRIPPSGNNIVIPVASSVAGALLLVIVIAISIVIATKCGRGWTGSRYEILPSDNHCTPVQREYSSTTVSVQRLPSTSIADRCPPPFIVESGYPQHERDLSLSVQSDQPRLNASHTVLVIYSLDSSDHDEHIILEHLLVGLRRYEIAAVTAKTDLPRGNLPLWIEEQMNKADAVLCVCNEAFFKEWNRDSSTDMYTSRAVAHSVKSYIGGTLSQSKDLSKFIGIVLLKQSDRRFIPSAYLAGSQSFLVDETEDIARFVASVSQFELPSCSGVST